MRNVIFSFFFGVIVPNRAVPGNPRYQPPLLIPIFGYDHLFEAAAEIEIATMLTLAEIGVIPKSEIVHLSEKIKDDIRWIPTTEVDEIERQITGHDFRAWIRIAQAKMDPKLARWLHVPNTTYDPLDSGRIVQFVRGHAVIKAQTDTVIGHFSDKAEKFASHVQIGRTHGQHALPITVGFWLATILRRLHMNIESANHSSNMLVGKISGAVGAYNAQVGLGIKKRCGSKSFEERVLEKVGLKPARISTQILPPEPLADYLFSCIKISAALGQFGRDCRHLMRTEIGEVIEPFEKGQVGSSTMAHKRNPLNFENLEGTWTKNIAEFMKVLLTMISEHQRDLVASPVYRDFPTIVVNLATQLGTLLRKKGDKPPFIARISIDETALARNFAMSGDKILGEPIYIAVQMAGYDKDAHKLVNELAMDLSKAEGITLLDATRKVLSETEGEEAARVIWENIPGETLELLSHPESYIGDATEKTHEIVGLAREYLKVA